MLDTFKKVLGLHTRNEQQLVRQDRGSQSYFWMLTFATLLATLGILIDNSNVVVGAMLVAPLMTPISSLAVSIARGRTETLLKALSHLSISIAVVVLVSAIVGRLIPVVGIPAEALARARPNLVDLLIAIVAGTAGMYAFLRKDIPESVVGVAIAVSLLPPLSVVGLGLAFENWALAVGSTVLFFTNVTAILSASLVVLFLHGKVARSEEEKGVAATGWGVTMAIVVLLAVLLGGAFLSTFKEERLSKQVEDTIEAYLDRQDDEQMELESYSVQQGAQQVLVEATIRLPQDHAVPDVQKMTDALTYVLEDSVSLSLSLIRTQQADNIISQQQKKDIKQDKQEQAQQEVRLPEEKASSDEALPAIEATSSANLATVEAQLED